MADMKEKFAGMDTRKKITIGVFAVIVVVIIWQVMGLFGGGGDAVPEANVQAASQPSLPTPKAAPVATQQTAQLSPEEQEMQRVLKESQARYIAAVNEIQLLKVAQDMADINAKIMKSKEDTVTSQKKIVDMLTQPDQSAVQGSSMPVIDGQGQPQTGQAQPAGLIQKEVTYSVVSISQLQGKWGAVLSYASNLYSVHVGDVLPADNSTVVSIDKSNVVLEKDGVRTKISMVSVI